MLSFVNNKETNLLQYTESYRYSDNKFQSLKHQANLKVIRDLLCKDNTYHEDKPKGRYSRLRR